MNIISKANVKYSPQLFPSLDKFVLLCFVQDNFNISLFPVTGHARRVISAAIRHWQRNVPCLKFVPRSSHRNYVSFFAGGG